MTEMEKNPMVSMESEIDTEKGKNPCISMKEKLPSPVSHGIFKRVVKFGLRIYCIINFRVGIALQLFLAAFVHDFIIKHMETQIHSHFRHFPIHSKPTAWAQAISPMVFYLFKLNFFYMFEFHLIILLTAILVVYLASMIHFGEWRTMKLIGMSERIKWALINFTFVSLVSFVSYVSMVVWLTIDILVSSDSTFYTVLYVLGFITFSMKWLEMRTIWNVGIAISKESHGLEVMSISACYKAGHRKSAFFIMLLYFIWCFSSGISTHPVTENLNVVYGGFIAALLYIGLVVLNIV